MDRLNGNSPPRRRHGPLIRALLTLVGAWLAVPALGEPLSPQRQQAVLREALNAYDEAVALSRSDPDAARERFRAAIAGLESLAASGVRSAALEYNLGNAWFRAGRPGRAVLHYLRSERIRPGDPRVAANLEYVRRQVTPRIESDDGQRLMARLMFWTHTVSLSARCAIAIIVGALGWGMLAAFVALGARGARPDARPPRALAVGGILLAALGLANAASAAWQLEDERRAAPAVVVEDRQVLRNGRGEGYESVLAEPLGAGVELRVLERRGGWVEARLRNGVTGWLPDSAIRYVSPPRTGAP